VVGAVDVGKNVGALNALHKFARDEEVVEAPADVAVASVSEKVPV